MKKKVAERKKPAAISANRVEGGSPPATLIVGFVTPCLSMGGAERWVMTTTQALLAVGVHVAWIAIADSKKAVPAEAHRICKLITVPEAIEAARLKQVSVVVMWGLGTEHGPFPFAEFRSANCPVVAVSHGAAFLGYSRRLADVFMTHAPYLAAVSMAAATPFPEHVRPYVAVVYNGIDLNRLAPLESREAVRERLGIAAGHRMVLYLGRVSGEKRIGLLVDALGYLPTDHTVVLSVPAPERCAPEWRRTRVRIVPGTPNVGSLLWAADCLVLPSRSESWGLVLFEAMACSVPVVFCRHEGGKEIRAIFGPEKFTSPIVECGPADIAAAIQAAMRTPSETLEAIRQHVVREFSALRSGAMWADYLRKVVAGEAVKNPFISYAIEPPKLPGTKPAK